MTHATQNYTVGERRITRRVMLATCDQARWSCSWPPGTEVTIVSATPVTTKTGSSYSYVLHAVTDEASSGKVTLSQMELKRNTRTVS